MDESIPGISYIAAICRDPEAAAALFSDHLHCTRYAIKAAADGASVPVVAIGKTALALFEPGAPAVDGATQTGLHHLAIADEAPETAANRLFGAEVAPKATTKFLDCTVCLPPAQTAGVRCSIAPPLPASVAAASGSLVERFDHIGIAAGNTEAVEAVFTNKWGLPVESRQTDVQTQTALESFTSDKYGVVYHHRPPEPIGGVRVVFLSIGDTDLEILQPLSGADLRAETGGEAVPDRPAAEPGSTKNDGGALARFVAKQGGGLHHLALKVKEIDPVLCALAKAGVPLIDQTGRFGSRRAKIGFVHPKAFGGFLVHFVERTPL